MDKQTEERRGDAVCYLSHCCDKIIDRSHLSKGGLFWLTVGGDTVDCCFQVASAVRRQKEVNAGAQPAFFLLFSPRGRCCQHSGWVFPPPLNRSGIFPNRHSQRCVSQVTPNPDFRLTMESSQGTHPRSLSTSLLSSSVSTASLGPLEATAGCRGAPTES